MSGGSMHRRVPRTSFLPERSRFRSENRFSAALIRTLPSSSTRLDLCTTFHHNNLTKANLRGKHSYYCHVHEVAPNARDPRCCRAVALVEGRRSLPTILRGLVTQRPV